jgi:hypothetical protein
MRRMSHIIVVLLWSSRSASHIFMQNLCLHEYVCVCVSICLSVCLSVSLVVSVSLCVREKERKSVCE